MVCRVRGRSFSPASRIWLMREVAQIRMSASQMVAMPKAGLALTWTQTSPSGLVYSIGFRRLRFDSEKNGRSMTSR